jgi:flagellar basal-body rod protein FlgB
VSGIDPRGVGGELALDGQLLDVAALRHRTIASNLANQATPGWQRLEVRFEEAFAAAQAPTDGAPATVEARVQVDRDAPSRLDGCSVDAERELVDLSRNSLVYQTLTRAAAAKVAALRAAIGGR